MCGICGVLEYRSGKPVPIGQLSAMTGTMVHRGPDDEGFLLRPGLGMGMRRLSVIDLEGGHQPIGNETSDVWVILNGEIYNYGSLRKELAGRGHHFRTRSDTEVIVHLYEEYGEDCLAHLDGMFAFALYDARSDRQGPRLLIARDRLGKKPLFYADTGDALIFGSEIKPVLGDPRVSKALDFEALHHYLSLLVVPAPLSIFQAIRKLPPGCLLVCDAGGVRTRRYWNYLDYVGQRDLTEQEALEQVRRLLFEAVEKRLVADVPLGAFLSGGLDSGTVVALMSRLTGKPVRTFSIGFQGPATHNELPAARLIADRYHTDHHEFLLEPDIAESVQEMVRYADEPFAISSAIPTLLLAKAARKHVTVVLTGDGGDEVLGGYDHYLYERWAELYRILPPLADQPLIKTTGLLGGHVDRGNGRLRSRITRFIANSRQPAGQRRLGWASAFSESEKQDLYAHDSAASAATALFLEDCLAPCSVADPAARQNCLDVLVWLPDEMLAKVDRMTMGASLEARCPFLDWKLVEFAAGLSWRTKVPGRRSMSLKHLLRRAVSDLLPAELLALPKHGFNVPLDAWFRGKLGGFVESVLSPERLRRRGLFKPDAVGALLAAHRNRSVNAGSRLFALWVFEVWAEVYL